MGFQYGHAKTHAIMWTKKRVPVVQFLFVQPFTIGVLQFILKPT